MLEAITLPSLAVARRILCLDCEVPTPNLNLDMGSQVEGDDLGANTQAVISSQPFDSSL